MATVNTIHSKWEGCSSEQLRANQQALNYIMTLASQMNENIKRWNLTTTFGNGDGDNLETDPRKLNKAFFDRLMRGKPQAPATVTASPAPDAATQAEQVAEVHRVLRRHAARVARRELRDASNRARQMTEQAERQYANYLRNLQQAVTAKRRVEQLEADTTDAARAERIANDLVGVLNEGFWYDPVVDSNDALWLRTRNDVVLTFRNRAADIDVTVNLGRFAVQLVPGEARVSVFPCGRNRTPGSRDLSHPHVSGGSVCWGASAELANRAIADWQFGEVLQLLQQLLLTYCDDNPYVSLVEFTDDRGGRLLGQVPGRTHPNYVWPEPEETEVEEEPEAAPPTNGQRDLADVVAEL